MACETGGPSMQAWTGKPSSPVLKFRQPGQLYLIFRFVPAPLEFPECSCGMRPTPGQGMRRVTAPRMSIADDAFNCLEDLEGKMSQGLLNLPDVDCDDDDFEPSYAPPSASKRRPSPASELHSDRASMRKKSSGQKTKRPSGSATISRHLSKSASALKRKLDFVDEEETGRGSNNSEMSGTDDDVCEVDPPTKAFVKSSKQTRGRAHPRLSMISLVTPVGKRGDVHSPSTSSQNADSDLDDVPLSTVFKMSVRKPCIETGNATRAQKKSVRETIPENRRTRRCTSKEVFRRDPSGTDLPIVDLTSSDGGSAGVIEVRSSLYPLPVMTQSPIPQKLCSRSPPPKKGTNSVKRRRVRRIVESESDDDEVHANSECVDVNPVTGISPKRAPVVYEPPPRPIMSQPSESVRNMVAAKGSAAGVEWYQERSIDDFSDSDTDHAKKLSAKAGTSSRRDPNFASSSPSWPGPRSVRVSASAQGRLVHGNTQGVSKSLAFKTPPRARNKRMKNVENSIEKFKNHFVIVDSDTEDFDKNPVVPSIEKVEVVESSDEEIDLTGLSPKKSNAGGSRFSISVEKPPPFRLEIMCNQGESVMQMMERRGEDYVMEKVLTAQNEGREIVGGEELGISSEPSRPSSSLTMDKIRNAVHATNKKKRKNSYDPEKALSGEYSFGYRGKGKTYPAKGNCKSYGRGRGRSRGRGSR